MTRTALASLALLGALAACNPAPPPAPSVVVPKQLCDQFAKTAAEMQRGGVDFPAPNDAMLTAAAWDAMSGEQRDALARMLAFRASCAAGSQNDAQDVVIHSQEGEVLSQRTLSTRIDMTDALGD
jgi:hypothetical protein